MLSKHTIVVLGAGSWGTALANLLAYNGVSVRLWTHKADDAEQLKNFRENRRYLPGIKLLDTITIYDDLSEALYDQTDVLMVVPSHVFRSVLEQFKSLYPSSNFRIISGSKGIDPGTHMLLHEVVVEVLGANTPTAILSGPSFSKELALQKPTAVSLSGNNTALIQHAIEVFHNQFFRVYENSDLVGVQICGAVKNVIAIAVGIADGLDLGANARAALITRGLAEIGRLAVALGGHAQTMMSLAGVGDLVLTCTDNQSRNRRFGLAMAQGLTTEEALKEIAQAVEGLGNAKEVYELARLHRVEMPIIEQVYEVLYQRRAVKTAVQDLLSRAPKNE